MSIAQKLAQGSRVAGILVQNPSPDTVEIAGRAGADFVWIDAEHGSLDIRDIADLIRAADAVRIDSLVRVPTIEAHVVSRILDAGATGIIFPDIRSAAQLREAIRMTRFAPAGVRGACPMVRATGYSAEDIFDATKRMDAETFVWALIEYPLPLDEIEEIVATPGLDAIAVGLWDLAYALGADSRDDPRVLKLTDAVAAAAERHGVFVAPGRRPEQVVALRSNGIECRMPDIVVTADDRSLMLRGFRSSIEDAIALMAHD